MNYHGKKTMAFLLSVLLLGMSVSGYAEASTPRQQISQKKLTLSVGEARKLTVTGIKGCSVSWKSSKSKVASVTNKGKVIARKEGNTKVTVVVKNRKTKKKTTLACQVRVNGKGKETEPTAAATQSPPIAQTALPATSAAVQMTPPAPSETVQTTPPVEMDEPSEAATTGSVSFRAKCIEYSSGYEYAGMYYPQGYTACSMQDLAKVEEVMGKTIFPEGELSSDVSEAIRKTIDPVINQYDDSFFQDKMLYYILFLEGCSGVRHHITNVRFEKNSAGGDVLSVVLDYEKGYVYPTVCGAHIAFLELNRSDFERADGVQIVYDNDKVLVVENDG